MSVFNLRKIQRIDGNTYGVVLACGGRDGTFQMVVREEDIVFMERGSDFISFVKSDPREVTPIYEAVLKFHRATRVEVVSSEA